MRILSILGCHNFPYVVTYITPHSSDIATQPGKKAINVIVDFLSCLWEYAKEQITREIGAVADLSKDTKVIYKQHANFVAFNQDSADVWLTVPAAWDAKVLSFPFPFFHTTQKFPGMRPNEGGCYSGRSCAVSARRRP
jgi:hypothetical protein